MHTPRLRGAARPLFVAAATALLLAPARQLAAQRISVSESAPHKLAPDGKKVLTLADYGPWKRITSSAISGDGRWATYTFAPNDGDDTLFVKSLEGDQLYTVPIGSTAGGGRGGRGGGAATAQFSDDSRWIAYFVNPSESGAARRGAGGAAARGRTGAGARPADAARPGAGRHLELLDLKTGATVEFPNAGGFRFAAGSGWLAVKMNAARGDTSHGGTDLLLRNLATGATQNVGNVSAYDFNDAGTLLAYTVDAADRLGNGVYLTNLDGGQTRMLDARPMEYSGLAWRDSSSGLAVLRGDTVAGKLQRANVLLAWPDASSSAPPVEWDPTPDGAFPVGFVLSEFAAPHWSKDGARLFLGIKAQEAKPARADGPQANLDIWSYKDVALQSQQMLQINQLRRATFAAALTLDGKRFVQLADSSMRTLAPAENGQWVIGRDPTPYQYDYSEGAPGRADYYRIDAATGERTLFARHVLHTMGASPDGHWFLYLAGGHVMAYDLATGRTLTLDAATGKSFVNSDDDHGGEQPIWGVAGWAKDGRSVLLYDKWDIWQLPLDGGRGRNLTNGAGAAQQVRLRLARFDGARGRGGFGGGGAGEAVDLSTPQPLTAYGEWTKKSGYWQLPAGGGTPTQLVWADKMIGDAQKAKNADRVIFTEQTFKEFPDLWTADGGFAGARKITDANPQISEFAWGSRVLVDYTNSKGRRLQGTLTLPADYKPGKKYPMIVYIYELLSDTHHEFSMPVYDDRPHMSEYASDGYLVFEPDIVYDVGTPGSSALDCVTNGVKKVIALGYADPAHIGLQGHSWGGYESSYILTQTNMFAAVVTGAPLTDLISMYNELYKQSGSWNGGILETSQGRMGANVTPWNATRLYESQSPLFNVTRIQTPFLMLQGTADGAVDWDQGLEFYNAARRNGKQVIWLSYPDEPHHLAKTPNQKDFQVRMKQFFDHYLKGAPAPEWMTSGLPQVHKGAPIH
jgi:hypothetical protein